MIVVLAACLTLAPMGACVAEMDTGSLEGLRMVDKYPAWASENWITYAASIVSSEARNVPSADLAVACTIFRDIILREYSPWQLYCDDSLCRWHGYGKPDDADYAAVRTALGGGCESVPNFRYVGNLQDIDYFRRQGWLGEQPLALYVGQGGAMVVGVP